MEIKVTDISIASRVLIFGYSRSQPGHVIALSEILPQSLCHWLLFPPCGRLLSSITKGVLTNPFSKATNYLGIQFHMVLLYSIQVFPLYCLSQFVIMCLLNVISPLDYA